MNEDLNASLQAYAEEMGVRQLSLEALINGHRTLRQNALKSNAELSAELTQRREFVSAQAVKEVKELGWFSVDRLKGMTLGELAELIRED